MDKQYPQDLIDAVATTLSEWDGKDNRRVVDGVTYHDLDAIAAIAAIRTYDAAQHPTAAAEASDEALVNAMLAAGKGRTRTFASLDADWQEQALAEVRAIRARLASTGAVDVPEAQSNIRAGEWEALTGFHEENKRLRRELATERVNVIKELVQKADEENLALVYRRLIPGTYIVEEGDNVSAWLLFHLAAAQPEDGGQ